MNTALLEAIKNRRTYYAISNEAPVSETQIEEMVNFAIANVPSAFNSQSTRLVLLFGDSNLKFWDIVKQVLKSIVPPEAFEGTEKKIKSFAAGFGTILYYEDMTVVKTLVDKFPSYADNFPIWSNHSSAMHQFALWTILEEAGLGASLQHYNPIVDKKVEEAFNIPSTWKLIAQMPFGKPTAQPGEKSINAISDRVKVYR